MEVVAGYAVLANVHQGWWKRVDLARRTEPGAPLVLLTRWSAEARAEHGDFLSPRLDALATDAPCAELLHADPGAGVVVQGYLPGGALTQLMVDPLAVPLGLATLAAGALATVMERALREGYVSILDPRDVRVTRDGFDLRVYDLRPVPPLHRPPTLGDLRWHAPELLRGRPFEERSAAWAVGEIAFTLVGGELFGGRAEQQLERKQREDAPSLLERRRDAPRALEHLLRRACRREPARRPSLGELQETLSELRTAPGDLDAVRGWRAACEAEEARDRRALAKSLPLPAGHEELLDNARLAWLRAQVERELPTEIFPDEYLLRTQAEAELVAGGADFTRGEAAAVVEAWRPPVEADDELRWMSVHIEAAADPGAALEVNAFDADLGTGVVERRVIARAPRRAADAELETWLRELTGEEQPEVVALPGRPAVDPGVLRRLLGRLFNR